ncbi:MAG TPA: exodeoxyribonuclease VII large subunit [Candidatus Aenigmarchaeota archaeon]|nr:exodeoxyribonuclease VII large subunit [Candidatus Aenigmarchaeota archaeon]
MISDQKLGKLALLIAIVGIIMIYISTLLLGSAEMKIGNITSRDVGKNVLVNGTITSYNVNNGNIFIRLSDDTGNMTVVMFERTSNGQKLNNGDIILVEGQVNVYKSELEIIAKSISKELS